MMLCSMIPAGKASTASGMTAKVLANECMVNDTIQMLSRSKKGKE